MFKKTATSVSAAVFMVALLAGCSTSSEPTVEPTPTPTEQATTEPGAEMLTPELNNPNVDIEQRSLADLTSLEIVAQRSIDLALGKGYAQVEKAEGIDRAYILDPSRATGKRGINIYFGEPDASVGLPEEFIEAYTANGGIFRLDALMLEILSMENILTYDVPAQGPIPGAAGYENIKVDDSTYTFVSPLFGIEVTMTVNSAGVISKIVEKQEGGDFVYTLEYDVKKYSDNFKEAFAN